MRQVTFATERSNQVTAALVLRTGASVFAGHQLDSIWFARSQFNSSILCEPELLLVRCILKLLVSYWSMCACDCVFKRDNIMIFFDALRDERMLWAATEAAQDILSLRALHAISLRETAPPHRPNALVFVCCDQRPDNLWERRRLFFSPLCLTRSHHYILAPLQDDR